MSPPRDVGVKGETVPADALRLGGLPLLPLLYYSQAWRCSSSSLLLSSLLFITLKPLLYYSQAWRCVIH